MSHVHVWQDHAPRQILDLYTSLSADPIRGPAAKACFGRGENLIDVHNPAHIEQVTDDLRRKIVERFVTRDASSVAAKRGDGPFPPGPTPVQLEA